MNSPTPSPISDDVGDPSPDAWSQASEFTERTLKDGTQFVRRNPGGTLIGALIFGAVIALLMARREPTARERFVEGPLDDLRDLVARLRNDLGEKAGKQYHGSLSGIERALNKARRSIS